MRKSFIIIAAIFVFVVLIGALMRSALEPNGNKEKVAQILEESFTPDSPESPTDEELLELAQETETEEEEIQKLVIEDLKLGDGLMAEPGDTISVHYTGTYEDGEVFDSSGARGRDHFQFILGEGHVIEGWERGIPGMRVGGVRRLTVPADLAYGEEGFGVIPPNTTLIFEIELLAVFE